MKTYAAPPRCSIGFYDQTFGFVFAVGSSTLSVILD